MLTFQFYVFSNIAKCTFVFTLANFTQHLRFTARPDKKKFLFYCGFPDYERSEAKFK